jgi:hypothetical protein
MTHARSRAVDRQVLKYMADHPGTRRAEARRIVVARLGTAPELQPTPGPDAELLQALREALAAMRVGFELHRPLPGKTTSSSSMGPYFAMRDHGVRLVDLDSPAPCQAPAWVSEYHPIITDTAPSLGFRLSGPEWETAMRVLGLDTEDAHPSSRRDVSSRLHQ